MEFVGNESLETAEAADTRSIAVELQSLRAQFYLLETTEAPHLFFAVRGPNSYRSKGVRENSNI